MGRLSLKVAAVGGMDDEEIRAAYVSYDPPIHLPSACLDPDLLA